MLKTCIVAFLTILIAYLYQRSSKTIEDNVIQFWEREIKLPKDTFQRIAIGLNTNVDVIVDGTQLLENLKVSPKGFKDHNVLSSLEELQEAFSYSHAHCFGIERPFTKADTFHDIIKSAEDLEKKEVAKFYVGGNAALMAQQIVSRFPKAKVQLIGPVGPKLRTLLNPNIEVPDVSRTDEDEFHLIMEYHQNEKWGSQVSSCANRFITSHDINNGHMTMVDTFFDSIVTFKPDLVILSGAHLLDSQPEKIWRDRIDRIGERLSQLPKKLPIHFELASMANEKLVSYIIDKIISKVTSLGLNEQEIAFLSSIKSGPHKNIFNENKKPSIDKVSDTVEWLLSTYGFSKKMQSSRLTRVHFHSLTFHVLGYVPSFWDNIELAVAAGTQMAAVQACNLERLDSSSVEMRIPDMIRYHGTADEVAFNATAPVTSWSKGDYSFAFSPVLVCKNPSKTVGLGDAISSTGLYYSNFKGRNF